MRPDAHTCLNDTWSVVSDKQRIHLTGKRVRVFKWWGEIQELAMIHLFLDMNTAMTAKIRACDTCEILI